MVSKSVVIVALCLFLQVQSKEDFNAKLDEAVKKCPLDPNVDKMGLIKFKQPLENEEQSCFVDCVYKDLELIKNNIYNVQAAKDVLKSRLEGEKLVMLTKLVDLCATEADSSTGQCGLSKSIHDCFIKNLKKTAEKAKSANSSHV